MRITVYENQPPATASPEGVSSTVVRAIEIAQRPMRGAAVIPHNDVIFAIYFRE